MAERLEVSFFQALDLITKLLSVKAKSDEQKTISCQALGVLITTEYYRPRSAQNKKIFLNDEDTTCSTKNGKEGLFDRIRIYFYRDI